MHATPEAQRLAEGISVNATLAQARNRARTVRSLRRHAFIAEIAIEDNSPVTFERTTTTRGHFTLWGTPDELLARVVAVFGVDEGA